MCFDESPTQLIDEVRQPIPAMAGQLECYDREYRRSGTANLFVFPDAHQPWRPSVVCNLSSYGPIAAWSLPRCFGDRLRSCS